MSDQDLAAKIEEARQKHIQRQTFSVNDVSTGGQMLEDLIYGANDGIITTFAIIAGVAGGGLSRTTVIILGLANILADGISMGMSNYLGASSRLQYEQLKREEEEWELQHIPEQERKEIEDIYREKGYTGSILSQIVNFITADKKRWLDEMMLWEHGVLPHTSPKPWKKGVTTFCAFLVAGFFPLIPYFLPIDPASYFTISIISTSVTLFVVGAARSLVTSTPWWKSGLEMLCVGAIAAGAAYGVGAYIASVT